jgi:hypothetical protein
METLTAAIIGHLVGDYLLQNDWMALNKKKRSWPCVVHCLLWTLAVCAFAGWWAWWVPLVLFSTHFIQDRTNVIMWWMKLPWKDQSKFVDGPCAPWSIIVVDNVWHIVILYVVAYALG